MTVPIDTSTPEGRMLEARIASVAILRRHTRQAASELEFLINSTPTSELRNVLTEMNIHILQVDSILQNITSLSIKENKL